MADAGKILLNQGDAPGTPASGKIAVYSKTDDLFYYKTDDGVEHELTASGSGATTLLELTDTPAAYDTGKYLKSTASGTEWATVSGAGGTSNHSELNELDYASAGHTGFQPAGDYITSTQLTTTSGDIVSQIPSLTGYATESYVDTEITTTSGDIVSQIPSDFYTQAEITTISGDIVSQIPSLSGYATESYVDTEITTASGDIVSQIPTDYYTTGEVDTISGSLQTNIDTKIGDVVDDTTPQLGGDLDLNEHNFNYGTILTVSGTYVGDIMTVTVDDSNVDFGVPIYQATDFNWERTDASADSTMPCRALALEEGAGTKKVLLKGQICDTSWNWSAGQIWTSLTTGEISQTLASGTSGAHIQEIGFALSADTLWFDPVSIIAVVE